MDSTEAAVEKIRTQETQLPKPQISLLARLRTTGLWRTLSSIQTFFAVSIAIVATSIIGTVIPQQANLDYYVHSYGQTVTDIITRLGVHDLYHTWWFNTLLVLLGLGIATCTLSRLAIIRKRPGTFVTHISILVILMGALIRGTWGKTGYLPFHEGETSNQFFAPDNSNIPLPFHIKLDKFFIEYYVPEAHILYVMHSQGWQKAVTINKTGQSVGIDGEPYKFTLLRFVPDLVIHQNGEVGNRSSSPNNPAILVEIQGSSGVLERRWIFERFTAMNKTELSPLSFVYSYHPGKIKDYKSKLQIYQDNQLVKEKTIEVNDPISYKGYTFYQSGYDPADPTYSSLQVANDPGVPVVYAGFFLLPLGLALRFYVEPRMRKK